MMKFELMYYIGMDYKTIMTLDLAELNFYYEKLRWVKEQEAEIDRIKLEAQLTALGVRKAQQSYME